MDWWTALAPALISGASAAFGAVAAIRAELSALRVEVRHAARTADHAHRRIDLHLVKEE